MDFVIGTAGLDDGVIFIVRIEFDILRSQFSNDAEKLFSWQRSGSSFLYNGGDCRCYADVQIGGCKLQAVTLRAQKDIGENRESGARGDNVLNRLQSEGQLLF